MQFVDYASGVRNHADVAARRAVLTGLSQYTGKISERNAQELDTDIVEVSAHAGARPDHAEWQGRWYSLSGKSKQYPSLVEVTGYGTGEGLKGWNCRHDFYPVIPGISEPSYTEEELKSIDPPPFEYNGKTYTCYEATQRQRYMERAMRKTKRELLAAESTGDKDRFTEKSVLLRRQKEEYNKFSKAAGLLTQNERTQVGGFGHSQASKATWAQRKTELPNKMAGNHNDWSKALPKSHSKSELDDIAKYAESRNIFFQNLYKFDGDIELLREQLDIISDLCTEFNIDRKINIGFKNMKDEDFAETKGYTIFYNKNVLRNRSVTDSNLLSNGHLVAFNTSGITIHEMGHVLTRKYNINGLDIFKKSYYNLYKKEPTTVQSIKYLNDYVSDYSATLQYDDKGLYTKSSDNVMYNEITSEMLVMHKMVGDDLADEFVRLIKEGIV